MIADTMKTFHPGGNRFRSRNWILAFLSLIAPLLLEAAPQEEGSPVFRTLSDLVLVDLVATDKKGRFVADLRVDDIRVLADGKPRKIQYFRLERGGPAEATPGIPAAPDSSPRPAPGPGGFVVLLLDLQTMDLNSVGRSKEAVREFLRSGMDPQDHAMLVTIRPPLRVDQPFTRNLGRLEQALDRVPARRQQANLLELAEEVDKIFHRFERTGKRHFNPELDPAMPYVEMEAQQYLVNLRTRLDLSCRAISALSRYLGSLPGRKRVLYFSEGYALHVNQRVSEIVQKRSEIGLYGPFHTPFVRSSRLKIGSLASVFMRHLRSAIDRANRNQVSVYSIDPRGTMTFPVEMSGYFDTADMEASLEFLANLSEDTGGLLFANENDLSRPVQAAYRDKDSYYLLGFVPDAKLEKGKFRRIEVKVRRKGLNLRYRQGYEEIDPVEAARADLGNAFKFPDLYRDFPFRLSVRNQGEQWVVRPRIPNRALFFVADGDRKRCQLEIFGISFNESGEPLGEDFLFVKALELDFSEQELVSFLQNYKTVGPSLEAKWPEDGRSLVVVLRQRLSGKLSAATHSVGGKADLSP